EFEKSCRKYNIPYIVVGGMSFYKRKEVKDVLAYLRTLINPRDREAILRIINEPARGIGETSLKHINSYAIENGLSFYEALRNADNIEELVPKSKNAIKQFVEFIDNYRQKLSSEDYASVVAEYIKKTGLIEFYQEIGTDEAYDRIENIEQVVSDITYFAEENPDSTLNDYIQQMSLVADIDTSDLTKERLPIMTLHSAKGLEFKYVFIAGIEDGTFPISRATFNKDEEEEERRLFYVGITRAKEKLTLTYARSRMKFGDIMMQKPSYFLKEIEPSLLRHLNTSGAPISTTKPSYNARPYKSDYYEQQDNDNSYSQIEKTVYDFRVGDLVRHSQFGVGKITGLSGEGSMRKATVNFANIGKKLLLLQYAKLEVIKQAEQ
ncbi:MAG TPA: 3'-5' exonuclease, partial [Candidatus Kapabacteria bacterium]|nr:3'-5' exonuclease [Candidatus Kapabacteria bacterium]